MGVRGLTSYVAQRAEIYLKVFELHDTNLVVDGDNLACNLYRDVTGYYSAFGGDYDDFYRAVIQFFKVLAECNIHAYVLMDGGYENRKLGTVQTRLRNKISVIKRIDPCSSITLFPLQMKEVFVDAVKDSAVPIMRCVFEADDELAALARKLDCPVLSYDSDFYIHNVKYIPLITLTAKVMTKSVKKATTEPGRFLRKKEAKPLEKRAKAHIIVSGVQETTESAAPEASKKTYKYLDCCIYRVEHLCGSGVLSPEKLPLFAALLGNDYIARSAFRNFFMNGLGKAGRSRKTRQQQRRIRIILKWLKGETVETALAKILTRLKKAQRDSLVAQVEAAISGYSNEICHAYDYFQKHYEQPFYHFEQNELLSNLKEKLSDEIAKEIPLELSDNENDIDEQDEANENSSSTDNEEQIEEEAEEDAVEDKTLLFPQWFLDKLYPANLPRFFVDLLYLRKYINNPQIEHFPYNEANQLALPILNYIFALLHTAQEEEGSQEQKQICSTEPKLLEYTYMSRAVRVTNVWYHRIAIELPKLAFVPTAPDARHLSAVFQNLPDVNVALLFERLELLPQDLQLYCLAIVYWLHKSESCDLLHLHALLVCLVTLRTIDKIIPAERELRQFQRRFGKIIKQERTVRMQEVQQGISREIKPSLLELTVPERMAHVPKSDCYLVQERLLPHFHMQEIFKKKYDLFSTVVLHGFAEFQSVVYQLSCLNALLDFPRTNPRMNQLYCGALLYNLYDLLRNRADVDYHIEHFIFKDSRLMLDFYRYLYNWCAEFVPKWKQTSSQQEAAILIEKKRLKKQRQKERKAAAANEPTADPNADMAEESQDNEEFYDLNNQFCALKVT